MDNLEKRQTEMLIRINHFGIENNSTLKDFPKAIAAFTGIKTALENLENNWILRTSSAGTIFSFSGRRKTVRRVLLRNLTLIAQNAAEIQRDSPGFINKFRLPKINRSDLDYLETARAFAVDLPAVKTLFVENGLENDFIEKLTADTDDFENSINQQNFARRERIEANADIDGIILGALAAVRTLKVIVPNIFRRDPGKLADWESASHLEKPVRRKLPESLPAI